MAVLPSFAAAIIVGLLLLPAASADRPGHQIAPTSPLAEGTPTPARTPGHPPAVGTFGVPGQTQSYRPGPQFRPAPGTGTIGSQRYFVNKTLQLSTGTVVSGIPTTYPNVAQPWGVAYDPNGSKLFVVGYASGQVGEYWASNGSLVRSVGGLGHPFAVSVDPGRGQVFVGSGISRNVTVLSAANLSFEANLTVGLSPSAFAFDNRTGEMFVADLNGQAVSVINDTTDTVAGTIGVGASPGCLAYLYAADELLVGNVYTNNITVVNASSWSIVRNISTGGSPQALAYDPVRDAVYVVEQSPDGVAKLSVVNDTLGSLVSVGAAPSGAAYDTRTSQVFVSSTISGTVSVISAATDSVVTTINVTHYPEQLAYDPQDSTVVVTFPYADQLSLISDTNSSVIGFVTTGVSPGGVAISPSSGQAFVDDTYSQYLWAVSLPSDSLRTRVAVGWDADGMTYDSGRDSVFLAIPWGSNLTEVNATRDSVVASAPTMQGPFDLVYEPGLSRISFQSGNPPEFSSISDTTLGGVASFNASGFPWVSGYDPITHELFIGDAFSYTITVVNATTGAYIGEANLVGPPGQFLYVSDAGVMYVSVPSANAVESVSSLPVGVLSITYVGNYPTGLAYDSATHDILVADSGSNTVASISDYTNSVTDYARVPPSPSGIGFDPTSGSIVVTSALVGTVSTLEESLAPVNYSIVLVSTPTTCSYLDFNGTTYATPTTINVSWGTYPINAPPCSGFAFTSWITTGGLVLGDWTSPSGSLLVLGNGTLLAYYHTLPPTEYNIHFSELGLPSGNAWAVTIGGQTFTESASAFAVQEPNGTYPYTVQPPQGWVAQPASGSVSVQGTDVREAITFSRPLGAGYAEVRFTESGLPLGSGWSVTLGHTSAGASNTSIAFDVPSGPYAFNVAAPPGYLPSPKFGNLTVANVNITINVVFTPAGATHGTEPEGPGGWLSQVPPQDWIALVVAGIIGVLVVAALFGRRPREPRGPRYEPPSYDSEQEEVR